MGFPNYDDGAGALKIFAKLRRSGSGVSNEQGVALIIVLWIFIFLFAVAFNFSATVREEADATHRFNEDTEGYYLALAGFQRGLYEYVTQPPTIQQQQPQPQQQQQKESPAGFFDGTWREENLGNGISKVRLIDEAGKINLNRTDENTFRRIFTNLGIEEPQISILTDSILDWIDPDDLHRINGAENDYYQSLSPPYSAKNGPFDSVEDLLWVRGVTSELFFGSRREGEEEKVGLRQIFTVDSPIDRVNLRTAPAEVIHALMGISLEKSRAFIEQRKKLSEKTINDLLPLLGLTSSDTAMQMFVFTTPSVITVEAQGLQPDSRIPRRLKGVVRMAAGAGRVELIRWVDRDGSPSAD